MILKCYLFSRNHPPSKRYNHLLYGSYIYVHFFLCCFCGCFCCCCYCCCCFGTMNLTSSLPLLSLDTPIQEETFGVHKETQNHMNTEEVTLEPTPPLKRIYTPPSIKVLFPLNQCKSSFRKFAANSIKAYTSQYNKNIIHNFSDHILTEDELSVLTKGLSFVPIPTKTFKQGTNRFWNKFKTRMLTQYFFSQ